MPMTLKDIAKQVGCSAATVSRVLNGCSVNFSVKPDVRRKIMDAAEQGGYQPNAFFKALRTPNNQQISCLLYTSSIYELGPVLNIALNQMAESLEPAGFSLNYMFCPDSRREYYPLPQIKSAGLVIPDVVSVEHLKLVEQNPAPYVALNGVAGTHGIAIMSDEFRNMREIMTHLHQLGHRRIAYLNREFIEFKHYSLSERENAYCRLCADFGIPVLEGHEIFSCTEDEQIARLLAQSPTAVITYDNKQARHLLFYAWEHGISVPRDLSVITFNDEPGMEYSIPPLSCMALPCAEMGALAAELMMDRIRNPETEPVPPHRLPGTLILRRSTASAK